LRDTRRVLEYLPNADAVSFMCMISMKR
jgi:hypothetical protein